MLNNEIPKLSDYRVAKADFNEKGELYIVELLSNNTFIKINSKVKGFIDEIDGIKNYKEITDIINEKFNVNLSENQVKSIILDKLGTVGMIEGVESKRKKITKSKLWFHWNLFNGNNLNKVAKKFTFLFKPFVIGMVMSLEFILCVMLFSDANLSSLVKQKNICFFENINLFVIFIMLVLTSIFHEFGHIVASFNYSVKPRKVGIGLYLFMPVFFVDLSESWLLDRKKRCIIDLGGIYFQMISLLIYLPMIFINNGVFNIINYKIIIYATLTNILFNLNPTLRMDGYWALSDLTGVVNIHLRIKNRMINAIKKVLNININDVEGYELTEKAKVIFTIWSLGYTFITLLFLCIGIHKISVLLKNVNVSMGLVILFMAGYLLVRVVVAILQSKLKS